MTVPRDCIFGEPQAPSSIMDHDYGEFTGPEAAQAVSVARLAREVQGMDYRTGVALVVEAWDSDPRFKSTDPEALSPVRIGAMLTLLQYQKQLGDSTLTFQSRAMAFSTATDARLREWGLWVAGSDHVRAALRHAITALRRARNSPELASSLWTYLFFFMEPSHEPELVYYGVTRKARGKEMSSGTGSAAQPIVTGFSSGYDFGSLRADEEALPRLVSASFLDGYCAGMRAASRRSGIGVHRLEAKRTGMREAAEDDL